MSGWTLTPDGLRVLQVSASAWMSLLMSAFLGFLALTGMCSATHARAPACALGVLVGCTPPACASWQQGWPQYRRLPRQVKTSLSCRLVAASTASCCCAVAVCCAGLPAVVLATFYVMRSWSMWLGRTRRRGMAPELAGFGALGTQVRALAGATTGRAVAELLRGALCT